MRRIVAIIGAIGLLHLTSGCVAAAIPLAAGAAILKRGKASTGYSPNPVTTNAVAARSDFKVVATSLTSLPAPDDLAATGNPAIPKFGAYALDQAGAPSGTVKRMSAIVPSARDLRIARLDCGTLPLAVYIDLDPGRGSFDPLAPGSPDPALGSTLDALRASGIKVVWFTRLGANFAGAVRTALVASGLDVTGSGDLLVLPTDLAERKQSLRDEVAKQYCPIAMLGDERADFDELYLYLRNPDAAIALDGMIGKGWFLANPFRQQSEPLP